MLRALITSLILTLASTSLRAEVAWSQLMPLPDPIGVAAPFAGVSSETLVVAGGANFPEAAPWDGGVKQWHSSIFALEQTDGSWRRVGELPEANAYGTSVTTKDGILCLGGSNESHHFSSCFILQYVDGSCRFKELPSLPKPLAYTAGAALGEKVYLFGGSEEPGSTSASNELFRLDLQDLGKGWEPCDPLPGPGRILPVVGVRDGSLFVFSGASLHPDDKGNPARTYLTDAWRYRPDEGWQEMASLPRAAVAAPSPATALGHSHLLILGGDDGSLADFMPKSAHPGFTHEHLLYDRLTDTWTSSTSLPEDLESPVTTPAVTWNERTVFPSGEIRPGVRSPQVLSLGNPPNRSRFGAVNWTVVVLYLSAMIGVGVWFMKREASGSTEAYFRGGQRIPSWVAGLSIFATMLSALTFMGIPARAYQTDITWYIGQIPILLIVPIVAAFYLPYFRKLDLTSAYEYLEQRFNVACRIFASVSFMLFHLGRIAIVLYLPALALSAVSDISVTAAICIIGVLCVIYTVIGGIEAVVWTDAIQAIVLMGGAVLCLIIACSRIEGGPAAIAEIARDDHKLFESLQWSSFDITDGTTSAIVLFIAFFFNSFVSYTSSQDVVQRYVTTPDIAAARRSLKVTMWMSLFGSLVFFVLGVAIYAFYKNHPGELDPAMGTVDSILPFYVMQQLPTGVSGLVIAAIFAAAQSTISSSLNSIATTGVKDIDSRLIRPGRDDRTYLRTAQVIVVAAGSIGIGVALWMAGSNIESAFKTFNSLIGLTAGSLGGLFAVGVFTRRTRGPAALVGALTGFATVLTLHLTKAPVTGLLYAFIGFTVCFLVATLAGLLGPARMSSPNTHNP